MKTTTLARIPVGTGQPVRIMGVINVSPESFFKGSVRTSARALRNAAKQMQEEGADFIDVGAMSSAPYLKTIISEQEEAERLTRSIETIAGATQLPISVDSFRTWPALAALKSGAKILNDITGLAANPEILSIAKLFQGLILMAHPISLSAGAHPISGVKRILKSALVQAENAGIDRNKIIIDPGIGFFRNQNIPWWKWDLEVLRGLDQLGDLGVPLLVGVSRKSFIGEILNIKNPNDRLAGSLAATTVAVMNGASIIRTHDVKQTLEAVRLAEKLRAGS